MHMPIRFHLDGQRFDPETIRVMGLAYEMSLIALRLSDRGDIANDVIAHKIIERAKAGDRDPEQLCEAVLKQWRPALRAARPLVPGNGRSGSSHASCSRKVREEKLCRGYGRLG
jgi:hypothetical protein